MKICNEFVYINNQLYIPTMLIETSELYPIEKDESVSDFSNILYQYKVASLLFVALATRYNLCRFPSFQT